MHIYITLIMPMRLNMLTDFSKSKKAPTLMSYNHSLLINTKLIGIGKKCFECV